MRYLVSLLSMAMVVVTVAIPASIPSQSGEAKRTDGLVARHAYSLIRVVEVGCVASGGCSLC